MDNDSIKCIGVREDYRVYYNARHKEYFILTPNFRISRYANHCADGKISNWINNTIQKHSESIISYAILNK